MAPDRVHRLRRRLGERQRLGDIALAAQQPCLEEVDLGRSDAARARLLDQRAQFGDAVAVLEQQPELEIGGREALAQPDRGAERALGGLEILRSGFGEAQFDLDLGIVGRLRGDGAHKLLPLLRALGCASASEKLRAIGAESGRSRQARRSASAAAPASPSARWTLPRLFQVSKSAGLAASAPR